MPTRSTRALFFRDAEQLLTLAGGPLPRRGRALGELGIIKGGGVLIQDEAIVAAGRTRDLASRARRLKALPVDCRGRVVMPGFVDCHTHLIFAGSRVGDFERRIRGQSYEQISASGGGIACSARLLARASKPQLKAQAITFLEQFAAHGTTTLEVKSGYGLDPRNEIKTLEVVRELTATSPLELVPTLLAAHALPKEFRSRRAEYLNRVIRQLIPAVARRHLAEFVDCFCDRGAFTRAECRQVLEAGKRFGLGLRIHAEQLHRSAIGREAALMGAKSADHLDNMSQSDIRNLARTKTVAVLLPASNFNLATRHYPPARRLIEAGAAVALATDFNPGTSPTLNMQFVLALACTQMRMTPAEAIVAATLNAAYSLGRAARLGSFEPGKQADLAVMDVDDYRKIPYYFGWNHCVMTVKRGKIIYAGE